jgi:hypothetical protein
MRKRIIRRRPFLGTACALLVFLGWPAAVSAALVDTIIVADGGPGPYGLGRSFIDTSSIRLVSLDSGKVKLPSFTFIDEVNAILFSEAVDSGVRVSARFRTYRYGLPRTFFLFDKSYGGRPGDTLTKSDSVKRPLSAAFAEENLTLSGYKSVGVSVNNLGSANLEQALDVTLSGAIAPQTTLSGHLTDQGSSLEGTTREVADLDMVYVSLDNPRYNALLGDQYVEWPAGGMLSGKKKIKGISAGLTLPSVSIKGSGAISSGNFTVQTITGRNGLQGPYRLLGNGEEGFISPIAGTVRVSIGEKKYHEGNDQDFIVDYEQGSITFTPRIFIKDEDIIRVEYEYRLYDYQRAFIGTGLTTQLLDSSITIRGTLWHETDNKDRPLDMTIGPQEASNLAAAGDSANLTFGGRLIDPKDVAWQSSQQPLYRLDSASRHFYFSPFDPNNPADNQGYYYITFRKVGAGKGDYRADSAAMNRRPGLGEIETFVGVARGDRALPLMPLPQSKTIGEVQIHAKAASFASMNVDVVGIDHDRNLFSGKDDGDNRGAAVDGKLMVGQKRLDRRSVWLGGAYSHCTPTMTQEVATTFDRNRQWDDTTNATKSGLRRSWESSAGAALLANTFVEGVYGQYRNGGRLVTDHAAANAQVTPVNLLSLLYNGDYFRHWTDSGAATTRRGEARLALNTTTMQCALEYRDEWRTFANTFNRGMGGAGASFRFIPFPLKESVFYSQFRRGTGGLYSAKDTGYSLLWDQEFDRKVLPSWHVNASSHYFRQKNTQGNSNVSVLVVGQSDVSLPNEGIFTRQNYQVDIEKASSYVQVPVPAGKGLGDHSWDMALQEYVPSKNGDYIIQEQETYGDSSNNRVRKSKLNATWGFNRKQRRLPGILGDLEWSGTLDVEEHLQLSPLLHSSSWIPGYLSLFKREGATDSLIRYAALGYRQTMDWSPESTAGLHGRLSFRPSLKKIRDYTETGTEWGLDADRTAPPWFFGMEGALLSIDRQSFSAANSYRITDRHVQATEKFFLRRDIALFMKETGGWASKTSEVQVDEGWYSRLAPGISWQPLAKGSAEASYTWSSVGVPGTLDYRMAQGFSPGITHTIDVLAHINFGQHFTTDITYRAEFGGSSYAKSGLHIVSMQMKAFL